MKVITDKRLSNGLQSPEFSKFLKNPVPKSNITTEESDFLYKTLTNALEVYKGLGISANQLGINKRVCLIKLDAYDYELFMINPTISEVSEERFLFYESCLSLPKTLETPIPTIRYQKITVDTENLGRLIFEVNKDGDKEKVSLETLQTAVVQHEIDHLDGLTIKDRQYIPNPPAKKTIEYNRNDKVLMKSPTGDFVEIKYKKSNEYFLKGYEIV
jgi:peptide deformylase